jgi:hypothetical protein
MANGRWLMAWGQGCCARSGLSASFALSSQGFALGYSFSPLWGCAVLVTRPSGLALGYSFPPLWGCAVLVTLPRASPWAIPFRPCGAVPFSSLVPGLRPGLFLSAPVGLCRSRHSSQGFALGYSFPPLWGCAVLVTRHSGFALGYPPEANPAPTRLIAGKQQPGISTWHDTPGTPHA